MLDSCALICRPEFSCTTFLSGSAVYIFPFYTFCIIVIAPLGAGLVSWFLLLFSDRPLSSSHYLFQATLSNITFSYIELEYFISSFKI